MSKETEKIKQNAINYGVTESKEGTAMNRKNEGKSTNISRKKLFPLGYFKGKTKSNRGLTPEEDLLYDCAASCSLLIKVENLKMTNLDCTYSLHSSWKVPRIDYRLLASLGCLFWAYKCLAQAQHAHA